MLESLRRDNVGDGGRDVTGEKTPVPASFSLENKEGSNDPSRSASRCHASLGGLGIFSSLSVSLIVIILDDGFFDDFLRTGIGFSGICTGGFTGSTPSVLKITYADISNNAKIVTGRIIRSASIFTVEVMLHIQPWEG